jgi:hypothetical protein
VEQLLPPPYRAVWVEWLDAEKAAKQEAKEKENKVLLNADNFCTIKTHCRLQVEDPCRNGDKTIFRSKSFVK